MECEIDWDGNLGRYTNDEDCDVEGLALRFNLEIYQIRYYEDGHYECGEARIFPTNIRLENEDREEVEISNDEYSNLEDQIKENITEI